MKKVEVMQTYWMLVLLDSLQIGIVNESIEGEKDLSHDEVISITF